MNNQQNTQTEDGCCSGLGFSCRPEMSEKMAGMMRQFFGEGESVDCAAMLEKFRNEDGSIDCSKMMETMQEKCCQATEGKETN